MHVSEIPKLSLAILNNNICSATNINLLSYVNSIFNIDNIPSLTDEDKAVELIKDVIKRNGLILGVTDYDSDGLNSAAVINKALSSKSDNYKVIHNKRENGNGFNPVLVSRIKSIHDENPIDLIITADHGSSNKQAFAELKEYGIKHILVTDHHDIPMDNYPDNVDVFINPQKTDNDPKDMCGCFVVFKVLSGLYKDDNDIYNNLYRDCLPHVAIATVSDVMDMSVIYNREVVRAGVQIMNTTDGLWSMLNTKLGLTGTFTYKDIGFTIGPLINTGNRSSQEGLFYRMMVEKDPVKQEELIERCIGVNIRRKKEKKESMSIINSSISRTDINKTLSLIVDTSMSINGVIANTLGEQYKVPTTCFMRVGDSDVLAGSSRTILSHLHMAEIYKEMASMDKDLFIAYGGHQGAGGCSIKFDKFPTFKKLFEEVVAKAKKPTGSEAEEFILKINTKHLAYGVVEDIDYAGPYGKNWPAPKLSGFFKLLSVIPMSGLAIFKLMTPSRQIIKGTYFYTNDDSILSIENNFERGSVVEVLFEPQYYRRYNRVNFTLLIEKIKEV